MRTKRIFAKFRFQSKNITLDFIIINIPLPENETSVIIEQPKTEQPEPASDVKLVIEKAEEEKTVEPVQEKEHHTVDTPFDPHYELRDFQMPPIDLLKDYGGRKNEINGEELEANKNKIVETLGNYGIAIDKIKATIGPIVTSF